jgi:hypothetical protein
MIDALSDLAADPLVFGVVQGDRAAWFQLTLLIELWVEAHAPRHWRMRRARLANSPDDVRDVLVETLERLDRDDFAELRRYLERKREQVPDVREDAREPETDLSFVAWLASVVDFAIREHVRRRYGRTSKAAGRPGHAQRSVLSKRSLHSWAVHPSESHNRDIVGATLGMSRVLTAKSILRYAEETFDGRELRVFQRYLEHSSFEELAAEFELATPESARSEIRRLKERLRARFRDAK